MVTYIYDLQLIISIPVEREKHARNIAKNTENIRDPCVRLTANNQPYRGPSTTMGQR